MCLGCRLVELLRITTELHRMLKLERAERFRSSRLVDHLSSQIKQIHIKIQQLKSEVSMHRAANASHVTTIQGLKSEIETAADREDQLSLQLNSKDMVSLN